VACGSGLKDISALNASKLKPRTEAVRDVSEIPGMFVCKMLKISEDSTDVRYFSLRKAV
jgi:F420-0:gamma-glutamyl ligase-like protein